jgi:hypothetical protein
VCALVDGGIAAKPAGRHILPSVGSRLRSPFAESNLSSGLIPRAAFRWNAEFISVACRNWGSDDQFYFI